MLAQTAIRRFMLPLLLLSAPIISPTKEKAKTLASISITLLGELEHDRR